MDNAEKKLTDRKKHPGGRPSKLTPELQAKIRQYILADNYFNVACWGAGITPQTGYNWLDRGEKDYAAYETDETGETPLTIYAEFWFSINQSEAQAEISDIAYIKTGNDNWQSRAWIRERRNKERWGKKEYQEVKVLGTIGVKAEDLSDDDLADIIKRRGSSAGAAKKKKSEEQSC